MLLALDPIEVRVLGSLIEKEITTPEYYPLTVNAILAACNQKSNREPVVAYDEPSVAAALRSLEDKELVDSVTPSGSRVEKFEQRLAARLNLGRRELALLDVLMLRGPQTLGELHARTARMHGFSDNDEIEAVLDRMAQWRPDPLVVRLARTPGAREPRYMHLLTPFSEPAPPVPEPRAAASPDDEIAALRGDIARLEQELRDLRAEFANFRRQLWVTDPYRSE
ncbi:MAG: YceH family protein [Bryobacteraceae bacterium]|nr:YceH family protein [Bryobacteraceae bacterium]